MVYQNFSPNQVEEFKFIKKTIKMAEQAEQTFTKGLLNLESRMEKIEKTSHKIQKLYKKITHALETG